jgi:hypothetical protein
VDFIGCVAPEGGAGVEGVFFVGEGLALPGGRGVVELVVVFGLGEGAGFEGSLGVGGRLF